MSDSMVNNDTTHASILQNYAGADCTQDLPSEYFTDNISLNEQVSNVVNVMNDQMISNHRDILPNNNVGNNEDLMECLTDGGCVLNTSVLSKVSSGTICGLDSNSDDQKNTNPETDNGSKKVLIVKLETPILSNKLTSCENNTFKNTNKVGMDHIVKSESMEKSVTFSAVIDVNNGIRKKRRRKRENVAISKPVVGYKRTQQRVRTGRGRPPKRPIIATYHSQISGDKNTIKIRIKKADFTPQVATSVKKSRQRQRQKRVEESDTDVSDYEDNKRAKTEQTFHCKTEDQMMSVNPHEQSVWGKHIPQNFLYKVFQYLCHDQGALPLLVKLCKICKLWRSVAMSSALWETIDLSSCVNDRSKTDFRLQWLIQNRLKACLDLNLTEWKIQNIPVVLEQLCGNCPNLRGLNLSGWSGLTAEHLKYLTSECAKLERLDLSAVHLTNQGTKSALNATPLMSLAQTMGNRLTHLVLAHNKLAGFSQILTAISTNCPNLQLLDLSNIRTRAYNSSLLHVEKLQAGCTKLRVLRVTNSLILLAPTSITAQMSSPGFPELEELSLAGIEDDQTTSKFIDDDGIERILKSSHKLRLLDVRGCTKITDSGLVKVPAWDLEHLFLSACNVTRLNNSGLELILQKWSHSLVEVDLAWSTATEPLDAAVLTLAEKGKESPLRTLDLCGSSVSLEPVKAVLNKCPHIQSINLQSCRALPRGIKRLYKGSAVAELCAALEDKPKSEEPDSKETDEPADVSGEKTGTVNIP